MTFKRAFRDAFSNRAKYFVRWGIAEFVFYFGVQAMSVFLFVQVVIHGSTRAVALPFWYTPALVALGIAAGIAFVGSAFTFLIQVYRVRKYLQDVGGLVFKNWFLTVICFGLPIVNFFLPWNRINVIEGSLQTYRRTGTFEHTIPDTNKLRRVGIIWGVASFMSFRIYTGSEVINLGIVVLLDIVEMLLLLWAFITATRWLTELVDDFDAAQAQYAGAGDPPATDLQYETLPDTRND